MWHENFGVASSIDWGASQFDGAGHLVTVGHTETSTTDVALLVVKQNQEGDIVWQQEYKVDSSSKNYGIALALDAQGSIYIAGACSSALSTQGLNFLLLKFNSAGTLLWQNQLNGNGNGDDIPTSILLTTAGNLYVTGLSKGVQTDIDFLTLRISPSNGSISWQQTYDFAQLPDVPVQVSQDADSILVTGASAANALDWDMVVLKYSSTGTSLSSKRLSNIGVGFDLPKDIARDELGNFYLTGTAATSLQTYDIKLLKLNPNLDVLWQNEFDGGLPNDSGNAIVMDDEGSIYAIGTFGKPGNESALSISKLDSTGQIIWQKERPPLGSERRVDGLKASFDALGHLIIASQVTRDDGNSEMLISSYDTSGTLLWERRHDGTTGGKDLPIQLLTQDNGDIYVMGKSGKYYVTFRLTQQDRAAEVHFDQDSIPTHIEQEFIIRFNPTAVSKSWANNLELTYGRVTDIITDTAFISRLDNFFKAGGALSDWHLYRIFSGLKTTDEHFTSRLGHTVPLPSLWSALLLKAETSEEIDERLLSTYLDTFGLASIWYAHPNYVGQIASFPHSGPDCNAEPDDNLFDQQYSLSEGDGQWLPLVGHINICEAWSLGLTDGARVGVFDTGIKSDHSDFTTGGNAVGGSWDFTVVPPVIAPPGIDQYGHGTSVSGIVGAIRDNDIGVAGVAGGEGQPGTSLFSWKVFLSSGDFLSQLALTDALMSAMTGGYVFIGLAEPPGLGVINCSFDNTPEIGDLLYEMYRLVYYNDVVSVGSRGNQGDEAENLPATLRENWSFNIGASGTDGNYKNGNNGDPLFPGDDYTSSFGKKLDLIAPGTAALVLTTDKNGGYSPFNGTSASAPHAAAAAAIMLQIDPNLYPEDVEHILEYTAIDQVATQGNPFPLPGYDDHTGWGLLNVGAAATLLSSKTKVVHVKVRHYITPEEIEGEACVCPPNDCLCLIALSRKYFSVSTNDSAAIPADVGLFMKPYKHWAEVNFDLSVYDGVTITDLNDPEKRPYWAINGHTNLTGKPLAGGSGSWIFDPENGVWISDDALISPDRKRIEVDLVGYAFDLVECAKCPPGMQIPFHFPEGEHQIEFSLLVDDPLNSIPSDNIITSNKEPNLATNTVQLHPNPTSDVLYISTKVDFSGDVLIALRDLSGRAMLQSVEPHFGANLEKAIDIAVMPPGIYFLTIQTKDSIFSFKIIKQ